jgi:hypothetical protein
MELLMDDEHQCAVCGYIEVTAEKLIKHVESFHPHEWNAAPRPTPTTDVDEFIRLVTFCRNNGYRIGAVKLGSLELAFQDLRLDKREGLAAPDHQPREDMWTAAGMDAPPVDGTVG